MHQLLNHWVARWTLALLSGCLLRSTLGLTPHWAIALVAPAPALVAVLTARRREAMWLAWTTAAIGVSTNYSFFLITAGPVATGIILTLQTLGWGFYLSASRATILSSRSWFSVFAFPVHLVALESIVAAVSPHGSWGSLAYTQAGALPLIQIAPIFGLAGVAFIVALVPSTLAVSIWAGTQLDRPRLAVGVPLLIIGLALGWGGVQLRTRESQTRVRVGVTAIDDYLGSAPKLEDSDRIWRGYETNIERLAVAGARIVVLPEKIAKLDSAEAVRRQQQLSQLATRLGVTLIVGVELREADAKHNIAWVIPPGDRTVARYEKHHLVPYVERELVAGTNFVAIDFGGHNLGVAICRDLFFDDPIRHYGRAPVAALLVPGWDFDRDAWLAASIAALRGVENGCAVIRAGREGFLCVSDRHGRILARKRSANFPGESILADLPLERSSPKLYPKFGNVFGGCCVALSAFILFCRMLAMKPKS